MFGSRKRKDETLLKKAALKNHLNNIEDFARLVSVVESLHKRITVLEQAQIALTTTTTTSRG